MRGATERSDRDHLVALSAALSLQGPKLALFLVYEHPSQVEQRPKLARTYFAERCESETFLNELADMFRSIGAYVEIFDGELPFVRSLADSRLERLDRPLKVVVNGIGFGVTEGGFEPGRMALLPALSDAFGIVCANSDAYTCAAALHRFHSITLLRALGVAAPQVWFYRTNEGWLHSSPPNGTKVIVKSTYEAWSVGVTDDSVFVVDDDSDERVRAISDAIGQPVTVQRFVAGREICVPVLAGANRKMVLPPTEQVLAKAPRDPNAIRTLSDNLGAEAVAYAEFDGPVELLDEVRRTTLDVFTILQLRGLGRMDFRVDSEGIPWLTDIAVMPGLSSASSTFASVAPWGLAHPTFVKAILAASLEAGGHLAMD